MLQDQIEFDQLDDRFSAVYASTNRTELEAVISDLPTPPPPVRAPTHPLPSTRFSLFGDTKVGGWISVESDLSYVTVFGDTVIDLSSATIECDVTVTIRSLFGDSTVILPDGTRASLQAVSLFGDTVDRLVPPVAEAPTVRVICQGVFGDSKLYSLSQLPKGKIRRLWRAFRDSRV